jgi:hypothetical protein
MDQVFKNFLQHRSNFQKLKMNVENTLDYVEVF